MYDAMKQVGAGDHAAFFYRNRKEQFEVMMPYIRIGLERNERCFYVVGDNTIRAVLDAMAGYGIDVETHAASGALTVTTVQDAFLKKGPFDARRMVEDLGREITRSLELGFSGFRGTGEMMWTLSMPGSAETLRDYESILDRQFPSRFVAICQYNELHFSPEATAHVLRTHAKVVARGRVFPNAYHSLAQQSAEERSTVPDLKRLLRLEGLDEEMASPSE